MNIHAVFYTDSVYRQYESEVRDQLEQNGFDTVTPYRREWLEATDFYSVNKEVLDKPRGGGYWLWKPYIILDAMSRVDNGDIILYQDVGDVIKPGVKEVVANHMVDHDYILINVTKRYRNKGWVKKDCFLLMDCDELRYYDAFHVEAGVVVFKKTSVIEGFIREWLLFCANKNILMDTPSIHGVEHNDFIAHREDQSVLSLLIVKHNLQFSDCLSSYIIYNQRKPVK